MGKIHNKFVTSVVFIAALSIGGLLLLNVWPTSKAVRVFYLVPTDREYHQEYQLAIDECVAHLQKWYAGRMNGKTFDLDEPIVEVLHSTHTADWFGSHRPGPQMEERHFATYNALSEIAELTGIAIDENSFPVMHTDTNVWLIYVDAPGATGAARTGYAILPEHDLRGLAGGADDGSPIRRWNGGSGHVLGHAFGLLHPDGIHKRALMQKAYSVYPDCELLEADTELLERSPSFGGQETGFSMDANTFRLGGLFVALMLLAVFRVRKHNQVKGD